MRENSSVSTREKSKSMREIFFESARENAKVPVKIFKKVCVKNFFTREKMKKRPKNGFTHTFDFHAEKKNTV